MKRILWGFATVALALVLGACHKGPPPAPATPPPPPAPIGALSGAVTDDSAQGVVGAIVELRGPSLPGFLGAATDFNGQYSLPKVPAGKGYTVKVEAPGYNTVVRKGVEIVAGFTTPLPFQLSQGATSINVVAAAPAISMKETMVSTSLTQEELETLPVDRSYQGVLYMAPSAAGENIFLLNGLDTSSADSDAYRWTPREGMTYDGGPIPKKSREIIVIARDPGVSGIQPWPPAGASTKGPAAPSGPSSPPLTFPPLPAPPLSPQPPTPTQGALRAQKATGEPLGEFPLQHTDVSVDIGGYLARTVVKQTYANPFKEVIEAVYVFPLGAKAAVNDFVMEVGSRKIIGIVRPREEAERIYKEARGRGMTASLLTQERPNIFTQNVANIEPGGKVVISITTFERLTCEKGTYEYVFPMVVGPRYIPGAAKAAPNPATSTGGSGWSPPTDAVPDADRITPPVLRPGERSGHDIGLTVCLDAGMPVEEVTSVAHKVDIAKESPSRLRVALSPADGIPNRDFVLRWKVGGDAMQFGVLAHRSPKGGFFTLMVQPPLTPKDSQVNPREITFLLDVSGSMSGLPVETSKALSRRALDSLRPDDLFNIFFFASGNGQLWDAPRPNTPQNVMEAKRFLDDLRGSGGTEMLAGVSRALRGAHDPKYLQMFVFATDGFVGDEERILSLIQSERGAARFFAFGIGNSVNRFLIDGIGAVGGGRSTVIMPRNEGAARRAADGFFACIDSPVLTDVGVDWNGLPVEEIYPARPGDLFAGGTINLVGRYGGPASGTAYITGTLAGNPVRFPVKVDLPAGAPDHAELAPIWARWRIEELSGQMLGAPEGRKAELVKSITELAVNFRLASPYTSFVAVDESRIVGDGRPLKVLQPVEMPEGVDYRGVFGEPPAGGVVAIPAWGLRMQCTASGKIRIGAVEADSPAAKAGLAPGSQLVALDGVAIHDLTHLEGLLLQSGASTVKATFEPGGDVALPAP